VTGSVVRDPGSGIRDPSPPAATIRCFKGQDPGYRIPDPGTEAWYSNTMRITIDKAGRVVIPAGIRERAGLTAGAELEVSVDEFGIRLERVAPGPRLVKVGRRTVARPTAPTETRTVLDVAALVEEERNRWP
jgi:AbrB family looped-hinge helix DNA binding protein